MNELEIMSKVGGVLVEELVGLVGTLGRRSGLENVCSHFGCCVVLEGTIELATTLHLRSKVMK